MNVSSLSAGPAAAAGVADPGAAASVAVQAQLLQQMQVQGAGLVALLASGAAPAGSPNLPGQGLHIDARA